MPRSHTYTYTHTHTYTLPTGARGAGARPERGGLELLDGRRGGDAGEIQSRAT